jgi:hypothetical protein
VTLSRKNQAGPLPFGILFENPVWHIIPLTKISMTWELASFANSMLIVFVLSANSMFAFSRLVCGGVLSISDPDRANWFGFTGRETEVSGVFIIHFLTPLLFDPEPIRLCLAQAISDESCDVPPHFHRQPQQAV